MTSPLPTLLRTANVPAATAFARAHPTNPALATPIPSSGLLPLHYAALLGDPTLIASFLSSPLTIVDVKALKLAASRGYTSALTQLIHHVSTDVIQNAGEAVFEAAYCGSIECVRLLVQAGAPTDFRSSDGSMPLHLAAMSGSIAMVDCLLLAGASPFDVTGDGATATVCARRIGHSGVVGRLRIAIVEMQHSRQQQQQQDIKNNDHQRKYKQERSADMQLSTPGISPTMSDDMESVPDNHNHTTHTTHTNHTNHTNHNNNNNNNSSSNSNSNINKFKMTNNLICADDSPRCVERYRA